MRSTNTLGEFFGRWWRFSHYELRGSHIKPASDAVLQEYNPWDEYELATPKGKGGKRLNPPYLSLVEAAESRRILDWCQGHGLLGLFFLDVRQVVLYPRWELRDPRVRAYGPVNESAMSQAWATYRMFIRKPTKWTQRTIQSSNNVEALTLPADQKPVDGLVPREYWDKGWEEPGVLLQDPEFSIYFRQSLGDAFKDYFPDVPWEERETFQYPLPMTEGFWNQYSESVDHFLRLASAFCGIARILGSFKPIDEMTEAEKQETVKATSALQALASHTNPALYGRNNGTFFHQWVPTSLIASYAMMALLDAANGLIHVCGNCKCVFVSSAGRARYCSPRCRKNALQRQWRARSVGAGDAAQSR
jgi:hypothetical protein